MKLISFGELVDGEDAVKRVDCEDGIEVRESVIFRVVGADAIGDGAAVLTLQIEDEDGMEEFPFSGTVSPKLFLRRLSVPLDSLFEGGQDWEAGITPSEIFSAVLSRFGSIEIRWNYGDRRRDEVNGVDVHFNFQNEDVKYHNQVEISLEEAEAYFDLDLSDED